jgi:hypothetical protein
MTKKQHNGLAPLISLSGEIRAADLDDGTFIMRLPDGTRVRGTFSPLQEAVITEALCKHASRRLHLRGRGEFLRGGKLRRIVAVKNLGVEPATPKRPAKESKPFWKRVIELGESIPAEDWEKLPADLGKNLDHYLYGAPKVKE